MKFKDAYFINECENIPEGCAAAYTFVPRDKEHRTHKFYTKVFKTKEGAKHTYKTKSWLIKGDQWYPVNIYDQDEKNRHHAKAINDLVNNILSKK